MADISPIEDCLPHRPPFLFVDRVIEVSTTAGHFKWRMGANVMGAGAETTSSLFLVEALAQSAAAWHGLQKRASKDAEGESGMLVQIDKARFFGKARPGQEIDLHIRRTHQLGAMVRFEGVARVAGNDITQATFTVVRQQSHAA